MWYFLSVEQLPVKNLAKKLALPYISSLIDFNKFKQKKLRFLGVRQRNPGQILDIC